jgi:hypothetical protein
VGHYVKLAPHRWVEAEVTPDGLLVTREFPCCRCVLYDATGRILAAHHACFQEAYHVAGLPPFANVPAGGGILHLPPRAEGEEDDLQALVDGYRVDVATLQLVVRSAPVP